MTKWNLRNENGLNSKPKNNLECVKIIRQDSKAYNTDDFDFRMCYWGNGSAGKILKEGESYSAEYKFIIVDDYQKVRCWYVADSRNALFESVFRRYR